MLWYWKYVPIPYRIEREWNGFEWEAICYGILYVVLTDLLMYGQHRLMHTRRFYWYHACHHTYDQPTAFNFGSVHFVEACSWYLSIRLVTFWIPVYVGVVYAYCGALAGLTILEHGPGFKLFLNIPIVRSLVYIEPTFHSRHHQKVSVNFGVGVLGAFWDHLFGSFESTASTTNANANANATTTTAAAAAAAVGTRSLFQVNNTPHDVRTEQSHWLVRYGRLAFALATATAIAALTIAIPQPHTKRTHPKLPTSMA